MGVMANSTGSPGDRTVNEILGEFPDFVLVTEKTWIHIRIHSRPFPREVGGHPVAIGAQLLVVGNMVAVLPPDKRMA